MNIFPLDQTKEIHINRIEKIDVLNLEGFDFNTIKDANAYLLLYLLNGKLQISREKFTYILEKNDFLLLNTLNFVNVQDISNSSSEFLLIVFHTQTPSIKSLSYKVLKVTQNEQNIFQNIILEASIQNSKMDDSKDHGHPIPFANNQLLFLFLELLFIQMIRRYELPWYLYQSHYFKDSNKQYPETLEIILHYLSMHLNQYLSLEQISRDNGISKSKLHHLFKKYFNTSVISYFSFMKIEIAKKLIQKKEMNFTQISDQLGYSSIHYFSKQFKQMTGLTPTEYMESLV